LLTCWHEGLVYDCFLMSEQQEEPAKSDTDGKPEQASHPEAGVVAALKQAIIHQNIGLREILTCIAVVLATFASEFLRALMPLPIMAIVTLVFWFILFKASNYGPSRRTLLAMALLVAVGLNGTGFLIARRIRAPASQSVPQQSPVIEQHANDSPCSNVVAGKDAAINCSPVPENGDAAKRHNEKH
jgi:hypothetical protein